MGHSAAKCPLSFRCNQMVFFISKCLAECVLKQNNSIQKKGDKSWDCYSEKLLMQALSDE